MSTPVEIEYVVEDDGHPYLPCPRTYTVHGSYSPGDPGRTSGPPDNWEAPTGPEIEILEIHYDGAKLEGDDWKNHGIGKGEIGFMENQIRAQVESDAGGDDDRAYDQAKEDRARDD